MDDHNEVVNANDDNGFTILHLAAADKQIEVWIHHRNLCIIRSNPMLHS